ncbi:DUF1909-domain-containing protein [Cystobasidium minutum MCA 4210]|uniref:DUF1909-domain-containing protein n=1 Tax=Cystobasidium minutum MCA 4210 TaxID=1397322 RepID=UPI0034CDEBC7|eukprot:jgi/Rhomi1/168813/fgenesh1_kg.3_\
MGNGAKAQQKRDRAAKDGKKEPNSQLKTNEKAMNKKCNICMSTFLQTTSKKGLDEHAQNKHSKTGTECFGADVYNGSK